MSDRTSIKNAVVAQMVDEFTASNEGTKYYTDLDKNVRGDVLYLDSIDIFPTVTIALGPERTEYHPSGFRWIHLTLYVRAYVKSEDESEEQLEHLIADIKKFIDNFERLDYTVTNPDGTTTNKSVTQMTLMGTTTDEGLFKPLALGELNLEVRYADRNAK